MHKSFKNIALIGTAALLATTPALAVSQDDAAQEAAPPTAPDAPMTAAQDAAMQAWPADQQSAFKLWPADTQAYFWTLTAERQTMFWTLSDSDKVALSMMAEPRRESTWAQIESRLQPPRA